jgi:hypothetical protein
MPARGLIMPQKLVGIIKVRIVCSLSSALCVLADIVSIGGFEVSFPCFAADEVSAAFQAVCWMRSAIEQMELKPVRTCERSIAWLAREGSISFNVF